MYRDAPTVAGEGEARQERLLATATVHTDQVVRARVDGRLAHTTDVRALDLVPLELLARRSVAGQGRGRVDPARSVFVTVTSRRVLIGLDRERPDEPARIAASIAFDDVTRVGRRRCRFRGRRATEVRVEIGNRGGFSFVVSGRSPDVAGQLLRHLGDRRFGFGR